MDKQKLQPILERERQAFYSLWHSYHAKNKIPYNHAEKEMFFNSVALIFREDVQDG